MFFGDSPHSLQNHWLNQKRWIWIYLNLQSGARTCSYLKAIRVPLAFNMNKTSKIIWRNFLFKRYSSLNCPGRSLFSMGFWGARCALHGAAELWTSSAAEGGVRRKDDLKEIRESPSRNACGFNELTVLHLLSSKGSHPKMGFLLS